MRTRKGARLGSGKVNMATLYMYSDFRLAQSARVSGVSMLQLHLTSTSTGQFFVHKLL